MEIHLYFCSFLRKIASCYPATTSMVLRKALPAAALVMSRELRRLPQYSNNAEAWLQIKQSLTTRYTLRRYSRTLRVICVFFFPVDVLDRYNWNIPVIDLLLGHRGDFFLVGNGGISRECLQGRDTGKCLGMIASGAFLSKFFPLPSGFQAEYFS